MWFSPGAAASVRDGDLAGCPSCSSKLPPVLATRFLFGLSEMAHHTPVGRPLEEPPPANGRRSVGRRPLWDSIVQETDPTGDSEMGRMALPDVALWEDTKNVVSALPTRVLPHLSGPWRAEAMIVKVWVACSGHDGPFP